jgi:uncharacterized protein (TIGR00725 family)
MAKVVVGVMGASESDALTDLERDRLKHIAVRLGTAVAHYDCILMTGATTGLPHLVCSAFRERGGFSIGVSPASNREEHVSRFRLPLDGSDAIVFTGFGLKGRNVVNVRSSDVVIIIGGATGTLNEFTIAYDEGKIIGVLEGTGGVADDIRRIIDFCRKPTLGAVLFDQEPERLIEACIKVLQKRQT